MSAPIRRLLLALAALMAAAALAPAGALAVVTTTRVTSPADPFLPSYDYQDGMGPYSVRVTGTTDSTDPTNDKVDVVCYQGASRGLVATNVSLNPDGSFSVYGNASDLRSRICRLRAVPAGINPPDLSPFTGPRVYKSELAGYSRISAGSPNAGIAYDAFATTQPLTGYMDFYSLGSCGLDYSFVYNPASDTLPNSLFYCNAWLGYRDAGSTGSTRSGLRIDGHNAYSSTAAENVNSDAPGLPPLSWRATRDAASGNLVIDESEAIVRCPVDTFPTTLTTCPQFVGTGVTFRRHIVADHGARVATITDTWTSTDGRAHSLDALFDNDFRNPAAGFRFPGQASYATHVAGDTLAGFASAPASIFVKGRNAAPDGDPTDPQGAITLSTAPNSVRFIHGTESTSYSTFLLGYVRAIPAGGSFSMTQTYSDAPTIAEVASLARQAEDRQQAPAVSISAPANGATTRSSSITVSGRATDNVGVASLTVGGVATPVGAGGAFSRTLTLRPGVNTITAVARDAQGNTAQASLRVTYDKPVPPPAPQCRVPRLRGKSLAAARRALKRAHCRAGRTRHVAVKVGSSRRARRHSLLGKVVKTSPAAGRRLRNSSKVDLYVGVRKHVRKRHHR